MIERSPTRLEGLDVANLDYLMARIQHFVPVTLEHHPIGLTRIDSMPSDIARESAAE